MQSSTLFLVSSSENTIKPAVNKELGILKEKMISLCLYCILLSKSAAELTAAFHLQSAAKLAGRWEQIHRGFLALQVSSSTANFHWVFFIIGVFNYIIFDFVYISSSTFILHNSDQITEIFTVICGLTVLVAFPPLLWKACYIL